MTAIDSPKLTLSEQQKRALVALGLRVWEVAPAITPSPEWRHHYRFGEIIVRLQSPWPVHAPVWLNDLANLLSGPQRTLQRVEVNPQLLDSWSGGVIDLETIPELLTSEQKKALWQQLCQG